jgi:hypothetical protein
VIQGGLLHNKETGAPQMDCVLALALQVMQGLQYLHERKVIHGGWVGRPLACPICKELESEAAGLTPVFIACIVLALPL